MFIQKMFTLKNIKLYKRLGIRYLYRNRTNLMQESFQYLNEDITHEVLSFFKYQHITDDDFNSNIYIFMYELFYISVFIKLFPSKTNRIIEKGIVHLILYIILHNEHII